MLLHIDTLSPEKFLHIKIDHERGRRYFAMLDPLVLVRLDGAIEMKAGNYYDCSIGWDRGDAAFVCAENAGRQHTKITLRSCCGAQPPTTYLAAEFRTLSEIIAAAPRQGPPTDQRFIKISRVMAVTRAPVDNPAADFLTLSEAARLLYGDADSAALGKLARLVERGELAEFADPTEQNPRKSTRVLKAEVRALLKKRDRE